MSEIAKSEANGHQENGMDDDDVEIVQADVASQSVYVVLTQSCVIH